MRKQRHLHLHSGQLIPEDAGIRHRTVWDDHSLHLGSSTALGCEGPESLLHKTTFSQIHFLSLWHHSWVKGPDPWLSLTPWADHPWAQSLLHIGALTSAHHLPLSVPLGSLSTLHTHREPSFSPGLLPADDADWKYRLCPDLEILQLFVVKAIGYNGHSSLDFKYIFFLLVANYKHEI